MSSDMQEFADTLQGRAFTDVYQERKRQDAKWGPQRHTWPEWLTILAEEFGEAAMECNQVHWMHYKSEPVSKQRERLERLRLELAQTAAVAVAMLEHAIEELDGLERMEGE